MKIDLLRQEVRFLELDALDHIIYLTVLMRIIIFNLFTDRFINAYDFSLHIAEHFLIDLEHSRRYCALIDCLVHPVFFHQNEVHSDDATLSEGIDHPSRFILICCYHNINDSTEDDVNIRALLTYIK